MRACKSGPDYIDPGFHAAAAGAPSFNLDSWAMTPTQLRAVLGSAARDASLVVIESAMGLFDGADAPSGRRGAAADIAAAFALPVLLLLDVSGQMQSAAAVARGFALHDASVRIGGVVLNHVASDRHRDGVAAAIRAADLPVLGSFPRATEIVLPDRHLGLVQASEHATLDVVLQRLADLAELHLDLDAVLALAAPLPAIASPARLMPPPGQRIAVAYDDAFGFIYPHLLETWRDAGAELRFFSPLADEAPDDSCDACWLPGGYPELHAARLANAARFRDRMQRFAQSRAVHGECGGYMVLGRFIEDAGGTRHELLGLLGHATSFAKRRLHLGYRRATLLIDSVLGPAGTVVRGHEFHYASLAELGIDPPLAAFTDATGCDLGPAGGRRGHITGSFFHAVAMETDA